MPLTKTVITPENPDLPQPAPENKLTEFRDDLRLPTIEFGRCAITGEWGKAVAIDLGDISIQSPDTERGVTIGEDGKPKFTVWKPAIFNNQVTLSERGLERLLAWSRNQESPIPKITTELIYKWVVLYEDGSGISQFEIDDTGNEVETLFSRVDLDRVAQFTLTGHYDPTLPNYTLVKHTGAIFKNGQLLDLEYDGNYIPESKVAYARKVQHTWGSGMAFNSLSRNISSANTSVMQLLGWKEGGLLAQPEFLGLREGVDPATQEFTSQEVYHAPRACVIAIDERGEWRPWEYSSTSYAEDATKITRKHN